MSWVFPTSLAVGIVSNTCGSAANCLLIYLVLKKTPRKLKIYSVLIFNTAICDLFACVSGLLIHQRVIMDGFDLYFCSHGPCTFVGPAFCFIGFGIMMHLYTHGMWSLLFSFAYRYYVLKHAQPRSRTIIAIAFLIYLPSFFQFVMVCVSTKDATDVSSIPKQTSDHRTSLECVNIHLNILHWKTLIPNLHLFLQPFPVYFAIAILRKRIISILGTNMNMSEQTRRLHSQLLKVLTIQSWLPVSSLVAVISAILLLFHIYSHPMQEYVFPFIVGPICALNAFVSLYFIVPYRVWILNSLRLTKVLQPVRPTLSSVEPITFV